MSDHRFPWKGWLKCGAASVSKQDFISDVEILAIHIKCASCEIPQTNDQTEALIVLVPVFRCHRIVVHLNGGPLEGA